LIASDYFDDLWKRRRRIDDVILMRGRNRVEIFIKAPMPSAAEIGIEWLRVAELGLI